MEPVGELGLELPGELDLGRLGGLVRVMPVTFSAMFIAALLCVGIGVYPAALYSLLPYSAEYTPYDLTHVLIQLQLLFFSALAFVSLRMVGLYPVELRATNLDVDWLYRRLGPKAFANPTLMLVALRDLDVVDPAVKTTSPELNTTRPP